MLIVATADLASLQPWFAPERPGPLIYQHLLHTGVGRCRVDRWPDPRVVLVELPGGNLALRGDPGAGSAVRGEIEGLIEAPPEWLPALRHLDPQVGTWNRVIATLPAATALPAPGPAVRLLTPADAPALAALPAESAWIHETWGGVDRLLAAGVARAAVVDGIVASLAVPFYVGVAHEDLGVVTVPTHRRRGLSMACASAVAADVRARGRIPTWTTSPDNAGSLAVADRLGFVHHRDDVLYLRGVPVPS